jgi:ABC-type nitrate/sulfonate/bicarbonate transport system permease component
MKRRAFARRALDILPAVGVLAAGLALWEVWVRARDTPDYVLPPPSQIWTAFVDDRGLLGDHIATTLAEAALGLLVGTIAGAVLAVTIAAAPLARRVLGPILVASQTIPMIVLAPLLTLWFGFGLAPKVVVVALVTFFPVAIATAGGLLGAPPEQVELIESMGATDRRVLRYVRIPNALPALFDGLRIAAAYTVAGAVIAEWTGGSEGLGIYISRSQASFQVDQVFVAVVIVAALSSALFLLVGGLARLTCPWYFARRAPTLPAERNRT